MNCQESPRQNQIKSKTFFRERTTTIMLFFLMIFSQPLWAEGEFPAQCNMGGAGMGTAITDIQGNSLMNPLPVGSFFKVAFALSTPSGYFGAFCAFEGGQVAVTSASGEFLPMAGFPDTPSVPMIYRDENDNQHPESPDDWYKILSPALLVQCKDIQLENGVPKISGEIGYGTGTLAGVPLESASTYYSDPPAPYGPGYLGGWSVNIDVKSYYNHCIKRKNFNYYY